MVLSDEPEGMGLDVIQFRQPQLAEKGDRGKHAISLGFDNAVRTAIQLAGRSPTRLGE